MSSTFIFIPGLFGSRVSSKTLLILKKNHPDFNFIQLDPGPVSSVHDRAIECFYQLRGGRVDYGEEHSQKHNHGRYGKYHEGYLKNWDENNPIHLIGYSLGGPTARFLQHLLITKFFVDADGKIINTSGDWISSLSTMQGCNNGSHCVHAVGLGLSVERPRPFTILWFIFIGLYVMNWLNFSFMNKAFPLHVEHWKGSRHDGASLWKVLSTWPLLDDNAGRDLSPQRIQEVNMEMAQSLPHSSTHYISLFAVATEKYELERSSSSNLHLPSSNLIYSFPESLFLTPLSTFLCFMGGHMHNLYHNFENIVNHIGELGDNNHDNHFASDGIVTLAGQQHPYLEKSFPVAFETIKHLPLKLQKGVWYDVKMPKGWNHMSLVHHGPLQVEFFEDFIETILSLPKVESS